MTEKTKKTAKKAPTGAKSTRSAKPAAAKSAKKSTKGATPASANLTAKQHPVADRYAVLELGSKQQVVVPGDRIEVELIDGEPGSAVTFNEVLLVKNGANVAVGKPFVAGASVKGRLLGETKGEKLIVFYKMRKENSRTRTGHRQHYSLVAIDEIVGA